MTTIFVRSLKTIVIVVASIALTTCSPTFKASWSPPGIPMSISIDSQGQITFSTEYNVEMPTPLGTFSVGVVFNPNDYFNVEDNILTVRYNGEDHFYDLHGEDFNIEFEKGCYEQITLTKTGTNLLLELRRAESCSDNSVTATPLIPTPSPIPTLPPNTSPDTILEVGQSWWQDKLELTLIEANLSSSSGGYTFNEGQLPPTIGIEIKFTLTNHRSQDISISYFLGEAISAFSNLGQSLEVGYLDRQWFYPDGGIPWSNSFETIDAIVRTGETIELVNIGDSYWADPRIFIKADITNSSLTEIIVSVSGVSNITDARWSVRIAH